MLAVGSATIVMLVVVGHLLDRGADEDAGALDARQSGLAAAGVSRAWCSGLAIMICYLNLDIGVYGTIWIMLIAYVTRFLPYGMRYNTTSMLQIHKELEESAAMSGASWGTDLPAHRAAAAEAGPARRLDLRR